jgi:RHS repeat-associated protein
MTNVLDTNTFLVTSRKWYADSINGTCLATNTFTWATGKVTTATDARNLTVTHFWDDLGRLIGLGYPDGSAVSNLYVKLDNQPFTNSTGGLALLDRTRTQDRMGQWTSFTYDAMRQLTAVTNALTNTTTYSWCSCGTLESVTDPLGTATTYDYDLAGRLTTVHRNGTNLVLRVAWNELDVPTNLSDNLGSLTLTFNHQGLWTGATNSFGLWQRADYDLYDRPTNVVAADGRRLAIEYDSNGRVLQRQMVWTNGTSIESMGYSNNVAAAVAYTDQLGTGITLLAYDRFGRLTNQVFAGLATNRFAYTAAGDLASLVDGKGQTTAWAYDAEGRALSKTIAGQLTSSNAYNANGWLVTNCTPARPNVTSYAYDAAGNLTGVSYSCGLTPNVSLTYDANNRLKTMADAVGNTTFTWSDFGTLAAEDGPWAEDTVSYGYNESGLRAALTLVQPNASAWSQSYGYDGNWRLTELASPAGEFGYMFKDASRLIARLDLPNGSHVTNTYDELGRLLATALKNGGGAALNSHGYTYDVAHQRTNQTLVDGNWWQYGYDALGQLTAAQGKEQGGTLRAQEQLTYGYDRAGNLTGRTNNGFAQSFMLTNSFNQLDNVTRSGAFTAAGLVQSATNVTVTVKANGEGGGTSATVYADKSFARTNITLAEGNNTFTAVATDSLGRTATNSVTAWLPTTASFTYDANGNLTSDGRRGFAYDDADQLTSVTVTNAWRSEFTYDALGRRRVRIEKVWKSNQWVTASETRYVYDHMLVLQERNGLNLPTATYTRGPDMSGGLQRAGGIGGLLALTQPSPISPQHFYYHADAGGNVTVLTDTRQAVAARYRYDPYGNLLGLAGPMAELNLYRFSSKEFHSASGLYYYGYRFSEPSLQRWINRDPIRETAGVNVYLFVENSPANRLDALGLWSKKAHEVIFVYSLGKSLPRELIDELARSSEYFDTQSMSDAYKHSLRSKGQDPLDAVTQRNAFVKQRIRCAQQEYYYSGDLSIAMHTLAEAMHAASDSTCPVHQDAHGQPRVWTQPISPNALGHGQWEWVGDETAHDLSAPLLLKNRAILQQILVDFYGYE